MSTLALVLSVLGGLFTLTAVAATIYVFFTGSVKKAQFDRVKSDRDDYLQRLNFIEPRYAALEEQNQTLRTLYDPSSRLVELGAAVQKGDEQILAVLNRQTATLEEIKSKVHVDPTTGRGD